MEPFAYLRPASVDEAVQLLMENGDAARVLAGGTDLVVGLRQRKLAPQTIIDLKRLDDLRPEIAPCDGTLQIRGPVVMTRIAEHETVRRYLPSLVEAAIVVGSRQIRNRATLAGNICNASPAADTVPVLAVHDATVTIRGPAGERHAAVVDFILGNRRIDLSRGEFVTAVNLPIPKEPYGSAFGRITRRRGVDLATVNLCCGIGTSGVATFALGAASPRPIVVKTEADVLAGALEDPQAREGALDRLVSSATPIDDVRASAAYRTGMLKVLVERTFLKARERLTEMTPDA